MKKILFVFIILALVSCKSACCVESRMSNVESQEVQTFRTVDTIYRHDSIFIREVQRGDTIYRDRVEYRDRWRIRLVHDTIRDTQYITQTIEHPPEKYVPKFYKWCTGLLFAILVLAIGRLALKRWL